MTALARTPRELRDELEQLIRTDLVGPRTGEHEELTNAPIDEYLLGLLAPQRHESGSAEPRLSQNSDEEDPPAADALPEDELATGDVRADSGEEGTVEDRPAAVEQLVPSAFGLTFAIEPGTTELRVDARWGAYRRATSEAALDRRGRPARVWQRRPCGGERTIPVPPSGDVSKFAPDAGEPEVVVRGLVRDRGAQRLVSLFLVNAQRADAGSRDVARWLCQAQLSVRAPGGGAVFVRRDIDAAAYAPAVDREELAGLELLHRDAVELAAGHGVAVDASPQRLATAAMPTADVALTDPPAATDFAPEIATPFARVELDMQVLAQTPAAGLAPLVEPLADAYGEWIAGQQRRLDEPAAHRLTGHEEAARRHLDAARHAAQRIRAGVAALADPDVAAAFGFANHAMWQQRVHTIAAAARRTDPRASLAGRVAAADVPENRSWRPFQLAFVLLNLPALADPRHDERTGADRQRLVDLLFFPTGGGKTEAYLGLTAFTLAIRRLQGDRFGRAGSDGVAVLMRCTLRLLTLCSSSSAPPR